MSFTPREAREAAWPSTYNIIFTSVASHAWFRHVVWTAQCGGIVRIIAQVEIRGQTRTSEEEPECVDYGKFAAAIKEKTSTHDQSPK